MRYLNQLILVFVLYYACGWIGVHYVSMGEGSLSLLWLPAGIGLASMLLFGVRIWPSILLGSFLANTPSLYAVDGHLLKSLFFGAVSASCNTVVQARLAHWLYQKTIGEDGLEKRHFIFNFFFRVALPPALLNISLLLTLYTLGGYTTLSDQGIIRGWGYSFITGLMADLHGYLIVTPLILIWAKVQRTEFRQYTWSTLIAAVSFIIIFLSVKWAPQVFFLLLPLGILSVRYYGLHGASSYVFMSSVIYTFLTAQNIGPFYISGSEGNDDWNSFLSLWTFVISIGATLFMLAGESVERIKVFHRLKLAKNDAEQADTTKSAFLANMSHEIRTPMNGVLGTVNLLQETPLNQQQSMYLETIKSSGQVLMSVINNILDYSKGSSGKLLIDSHSFNLKAMVESIFSTLHFEQTKDVKLQLYWDETLPKQVQSDSIRLRQILGNLLNNACKFTEHGEITVSVYPSGLNKENASNIVFEVQDTGIGIPEEILPQLFQSFQQVDRSTTRKFGGTGLGLAICKQLVSAMDGAISVTSTVNKGSCFKFSIPLVVAEEDEIEVKKDIPPISLKGMKVLVAEDNAVNSMVIKAALSAMDVDADIAEDGVVALEYVCNSSGIYNAIFMDCDMPRMDGYQCTEEIRKWELLNSQPRIPICAITAHVLPEHIAHCIAVGMDQHTPKPIDTTSIKDFLTGVSEKTEPKMT